MPPVLKASGPVTTNVSRQAERRIGATDLVELAEVPHAQINQFGTGEYGWNFGYLTLFPCIGCITTAASRS
jgi:hypothetical protein